LNLAKCGIDILVGYFGLAKGGNLNISVKGMLPLLKFVSDQKEHSLRETVEKLATQF